jgi:hypothetical protein
MFVKHWAKAALAVALLAGAADAGSSSMSDSGTISGYVDFDAVPIPGVQVGTPVTGSYTYNPNSTVGVGPFTVNPFTSFSLTIGSQTFGLSDLTGSFVAGRVSNDSTPTFDYLYLFFDQQTYDSFLGVPSTVVSSLGLATAADTEHYGSLYPPNGPDVFDFIFTGTPTTAAVPEPGTLTLAGVCVVGLAIRGWRRRAA